MDADERLEVEAAQQDPTKFGGLYERHFDRVYAFVVRRVRDRSAAEDITADVFRKALGGLRGFQVGGAPFGAWLLRIAANTLVDRAKRAQREVPLGDGIQDVPSPAQTVESDADACDRRADLFRFVNQLPSDQRRVIIERFVEQRSIHEIAGRLRRTEGAIKQLQFRALQSLRSRMEDADV
jgi:RNA polymerase sigma-70 factor, ECF subfamily